MKKEIKERKLDLSSSEKILENLTLSIDNLSTQINLLREDLRPELKKSAVMRRKKTEQEELRKDFQDYWRNHDDTQKD